MWRKEHGCCLSAGPTDGGPSAGGLMRPTRRHHPLQLACSAQALFCFSTLPPFNLAYIVRTGPFPVTVAAQLRASSQL